MRYLRLMAIVSFAHKGIEELFLKGTARKLDAKLVGRISERLIVLHEMTDVAQFAIDFPSYRLHGLKGDRAGVWSIWVNANWRMTFEWDGENVHILNLEDYH